MLLSDKSSLKDYLAARPELLGEKVVHKFGHDLPFLFKVSRLVVALVVHGKGQHELVFHTGPCHQKGA